jgi:hypothetical protein
MTRNLAMDRKFWAALALLGIAISVTVLLVTDSPGLAGLVASSLGIMLALCKLQQEKTGSRSQSSSAAISSKDQM